MILDQGGATLPRLTPRTMTLNLDELVAMEPLASNNFYNNKQLWRRVTFNYQADSIVNQPTVVIFDLPDNQLVTKDTTVTLPENLIGNLRFTDIVVYDIANGSLVMTRDQILSPEQFDIDTGLPSAPEIVIDSANSLTEYVLNDGTEFEVDYKVRLYDPIGASYIGQVVSILSKVGNTITLSEAITGGDNVSGKELHFAPVDQVVLDQLRGYKF